MSLGNNIVPAQHLEDLLNQVEIDMSSMTKPTAVEAYSYKGKTFNTFKEALREEFYDQLDALLKTAGGGSYLSYSKDAILNSIANIKVLCEDYDNYIAENEHPTISTVQAAQVSPGYDW